ncbi:MAG: IS66 family insertion sequence element accessory protein TnpB, partial [Chitinivibrionales bacterium]|nr:IS66 family insertion sequence element accessory protein TnpB [Chitinivibrionales bacterium]
MVGLSFASRIYLYSLPTDMRKSFDGLVGLVQNQLRL